MDQMLSNIALGFSVALTLEYLMYSLIGVILGTMIGVLPGLGSTVAISMLLPITFQLGDPIAAFIMFGGIHYGTSYGSSTTAILLKTPGGSQSVVTCIEGYEMARRGRAGAALATAAIGSFFAGTFATFLLMAMAMPLAQLALTFGPAEYFALIVFAMAAVSSLGGSEPWKAAFSTGLGLAISTVGLDFITGQARFTFGITNLLDGIHFVIVTVGMFAMGEVLWQASRLRHGGASLQPVKGRVLMTANEWRRSVMPWIRGTGLGFAVGLLPGGGSTIASFLSYGVERQVAKPPEGWGNGAIEGVAGPEAANNSAEGGALAPLLFLGIPASATTAVLLGGLQGHGITTGPLLALRHADLLWALIASLYIGNVFLMLLNLPLIRVWVKILSVPAPILYGMIAVLCTIGVYSLSSAMLHLWLMLGLALLAVAMRRTGFPLAPVVLAVVLGPMMEIEFRRAIAGANGDWTVLVTRPIALGILIAAVVFLLLPILLGRLRAMGRRRAESHAAE